jgi:ribonuclease M5
MNKRELGVVVEGRKDKDLLMQVYPNANILYLNGTKFNKSSMNKVQNLINVSNLVLILSDPDESGNVIAHKLTGKFPQLQRVEVDPTQARLMTHRGFKYGIEYCSREYLLSLGLEAHSKTAE